ALPKVPLLTLGTGASIAGLPSVCFAQQGFAISDHSFASPLDNRSPDELYAAGAPSCRVSQGGWERRDTDRYVGGECRQGTDGHSEKSRPARSPVNRLHNLTTQNTG